MLRKSKLWATDLDLTAAYLPELEQLNGKTVFITGAGGLICSALVDLLVRYNETRFATIHILAAGRSEGKMRARFPGAFGRPFFSFVRYDALEELPVIDRYVDYIIHGAGNASPDRIILEPVETMTDNYVGLLHLLQLAKKTGTGRVLYISSSEVYGRKESAEPFHETEYGFIDLLNPRNSYSVGKRAAETLCASFSAEYGVETVIARPGHIYGPTATPSDTRVSSAWAHAAARGEDIVMKSDGSQVRSYCYCLDCASALLKILLCGECAHAYNIANPDSVISIREMAEILTRTTDTKLVLELPSDEEKYSFNPMSNSSLDSTKLLALGWRGIFDAETGFSHTVRILKEQLAV